MEALSQLLFLFAFLFSFWCAVRSLMAVFNGSPGYARRTLFSWLTAVFSLIIAMGANLLALQLKDLTKDVTSPLAILGWFKSAAADFFALPPEDIIICLVPLGVLYGFVPANALWDYFADRAWRRDAPVEAILNDSQ